MILIHLTWDSHELGDYLLEVSNNLSQFEEYIRNDWEAGLQEIVDRAVEKAPSRTGALKASIRLEEGPDYLSYYIRADPKTLDGGGYSIYPELGTSSQEAQYFVSSSLEEGLPVLVDRIREKIGDIFRKSQ